MCCSSAPCSTPMGPGGCADTFNLKNVNKFFLFVFYLNRKRGSHSVALIHIWLFGIWDVLCWSWTRKGCREIFSLMIFFVRFFSGWRWMIVTHLMYVGLLRDIKQTVTKTKKLVYKFRIGKYAKVARITQSMYDV